MRLVTTKETRMSKKETQPPETPNKSGDSFFDDMKEDNNDFFSDME